MNKKSSCIQLVTSNLPAGLGKTVQSAIEFLSSRLNLAIVAVTDSATIAKTTLVQVVNLGTETTQALPDDAAEGYIVHVKRLGAGNVIVAPPATNTIDGVAANWDFTANGIAQGASQAFAFDGADAWYTI